MVAVGSGEFCEELLEALPTRGVHRRVQVGPLIDAPDDVGRAKPLRAVASSVPVDQPETRLVEGQDLQRLLAGVLLLAVLLDPCRELFLKASCSRSSAFSCRGRPVLSFALRRLRSPPTLSG